MLTNKIHHTVGISKFLPYEVFHCTCGFATLYLSCVPVRWGGGTALLVLGHWTLSESQISHEQEPA